MNQEFRQTKEFPEYYVNRRGQILSTKWNKERILKPSINPKGYQIVNFIHKGKRYGRQVHKLTAEIFIPNPKDLPEVNHKDGNKINNLIENLEWVTKPENAQHSYYILGNDPNKYRRKKVRGKNKNYDILEFNSLCEAGEWINNKFKVKSGKAEIWRSIHNETRKARGYKWEYIN